MSNRKIIVVTFCAVMTLFAILVVCFGAIINAITPKTYSSAKIECEKVLNRYQSEMEQIVVDTLIAGNNITGEFKEYFYSCNIEGGFVSFDIDAQGFMLGGQYWELVYTQDGTLYSETKSYLYKEVAGNNIVKAEKLNEHWWYLWTDYDGTERSYQ